MDEREQFKRAVIQFASVIVVAIIVFILTRLVISPMLERSDIMNVAPILVPIISIALSVAIINAITIIYLNSWLDEPIGTTNIVLLLLPLVPDFSLGNMVPSFDEDTKSGGVLKVVAIIQFLLIVVGFPLMRLFVGFYILTVRLQIYVVVVTLFTLLLLVLRAICVGNILYSCRDYLTIYNVKKFKLIPIIYLVVIVAYVTLLPLLGIVGISLPRRLFNILLLVLPLVLPLISFIHTYQVRKDLIYSQE